MHIKMMYVYINMELSMFVNIEQNYQVMSILKDILLQTKCRTRFIRFIRILMNKLIVKYLHIPYRYFDTTPEHVRRLIYSRKQSTRRSVREVLMDQSSFVIPHFKSRNTGIGLAGVCVQKYARARTCNVAQLGINSNL